MSLYEQVNIYGGKANAFKWFQSELLIWFEYFHKTRSRGQKISVSDVLRYLFSLIEDAVLAVNAAHIP